MMCDAPSGKIYGAMQHEGQGDFVQRNNSKNL
jgi:hypothetical protein